MSYSYVYVDTPEGRVYGVILDNGRPSRICRWFGHLWFRQGSVPLEPPSPSLHSLRRGDLWQCKRCDKQELRP